MANDFTIELAFLMILLLTCIANDFTIEIGLLIILS